ncbi:MAG TPA: SMC-Scp complex subunit ScpB [Candidatus Paceibacterota bacterium]
MTPTAQTLHALLFATADSYTVASLSALLSVSIEEVEAALQNLSVGLEGQGIMLVREGNHVILATRPEHGALLESIRKEELSKELSKASAETLAIVVYRPGATKAEIELIRGVNASYSIRALSMRGLIETKSMGRGVAYYPTLALLEHFGAQNTAELPQFDEVKAKIETLLATNAVE